MEEVSELVFVFSDGPSAEDGYVYSLERRMGGGHEDEGSIGVKNVGEQ
jgi:hypothetical protein